MYPDVSCPDRLRCVLKCLFSPRSLWVSRGAVRTQRLLVFGTESEQGIRPPTFRSPKQGGRDASSLGNLCIQRGSGKETSGLFYCLMEIAWHLSKRSVPTGSLLQQAGIKEKLPGNLSVSCSQVFKHTKFRVQARPLSAVIKS